MCQIFLTAKDLQVFFPKLSINGLRRKNTQLKRQMGKGRRDRLTICDLETALPLSGKEIRSRLSAEA